MLFQGKTDENLAGENDVLLVQREKDDDLSGKINDKLIGERGMTTYLMRTTTYLFSERRMTTLHNENKQRQAIGQKMDEPLPLVTNNIPYLLIQREADDWRE
jgi:hypothetical protein